MCKTRLFCLTVSVLCSPSDVVRYTAAVIDITALFKRAFDKYGAEISHDYSAASSPHKISVTDYFALISKTGGYTKLLEAPLQGALHPKVPGRYRICRSLLLFHYPSRSPK